MARYVTFDGPDYSGKTTLADMFKQTQPDWYHCREPDDPKIREIVLHEDITPLERYDLFNKDRANTAEVLRLIEHKVDVIVSDRSWLSGVVHADVGLSFEELIIDQEKYRYHNSDTLNIVLAPDNATLAERHKANLEKDLLEDIPIEGILGLRDSFVRLAELLPTCYIVLPDEFDSIEALYENVEMLIHNSE